MFEHLSVGALLAQLSLVTIAASVLSLILLVVLLGGAGVLGEVLGGIIRVLASLVIAPVQFLRRLIDSLAHRTGFFSREDEAEGATFLLTRLGQLLYGYILVSTAVLLTAALLKSADLAYPASLREARQSLQNDMASTDSAIANTTRQLEELQALDKNPDERRSRLAELDAQVQRLRATQRGYTLQDSAGIWDALVNDFYSNAWSSYTDGQDNVLPDPAQRERHRQAIRDWDARVTKLLDEGQITDGHESDVKTGRTRILAFANRMLAKADTIGRLESQAAALRGVESGRTRLEDELAQLRMHKEDSARQLAQRHLLAEATTGLRFLAIALLGLLLYVWLLGAMAESLLLFVALGRDVAGIRRQGRPDATR